MASKAFRLIYACTFAPRISSLSTQIRQASSQPFTVDPGDAEVAVGRLSPRNLEAAIHSLHEDGLVVVKNAIPHNELDHLNAKMINDAQTLQARGKYSPFNYNSGNIQQDPPPIRSYFHKSVFLNSLATQITTSVLGPKPKWTFCSGNSAMPPEAGSDPQRQPVHADADFAHPSHPFALVINVPLIDFTPDNGSTEIWLGTHSGELSGLQVQEGLHGERSSGRIKEHLLQQRRKVRPPIQPIIEKGSVVVRDLRLWHAGMPNFTEHVRVMLAMIHFASWYRNSMRLELAETLKPVIERQSALEVPVNWVTEEQAARAYLDRGFGNSYDFGQVP